MVTLKCKYGHVHSKEKELVAAHMNPVSEPHGHPRPYHCSDCQEVRKVGHRPDYWTKFETIERAMQGNHLKAYRLCFS